jgi:alanyl-tRNA synthetase
MGVTAVDDPRGPDCAAGTCTFPCDCGRYVEIWNLVFMQFNRDASGNLNPLPKPSVDTGMGLERVTCALLNLVDPSKVSNYDTDLFRPLIIEAAHICGRELIEVAIQPSLRIIADHSRAATFLRADGVTPSNEGRGYVMRKIIRRALYHAHALEAPIPFLPKMADMVRNQMVKAYPELAQAAAQTAVVLEEEEHRFIRVLNLGLAELEEMILERKSESPRFVEYFVHKGFRPHDPKSIHHALLPLVMRPDLETLPISEAVEQVQRLAPDVVGPLLLDKIVRDSKKEAVLEGRMVFKLYDTFGLPRDFIEDVSRDAGIRVDWDGFEQAMQEQRTRARASWKGANKDAANPVYSKLAHTNKTEQDFYHGTKARDARIQAIVTKDGAVNEIKAGTEAEVVLDRTSIYSESGGQVADTGGFYDNSGVLEVAEVRGAYYPVTGLIAHRIVAREDLHVGDHVATIADPERRVRDMRNHTATHLLNAALRNILGTHVKQAGSLVAPDHLRFDF